MTSRLWRLLLVAAGTLILCSCSTYHPERSEGSRKAQEILRSAQNDIPSAAYPPALPCDVYAGVPVTPVAGQGLYEEAVPGPPGMEAGVPLPIAASGPWIPPGRSQPWPRDEYLADGSDRGQTTVVGRQWNVRGLDPEDTVAHYDTLDGRRLVEPSNPVFIYSPRFGAVRQVVSLEEDEHLEGLGDVHLPAKLVQHEDVRSPQSRKQNLQAENELGIDLANIYHGHEGDGALSSAVGLGALDNDFKPYEDLAAIRQGIFAASELPRLAQGVDAAIVWTNRQAVQIFLDDQAAMAETGVEKLSTIYTAKSPQGESKLRITKVASTSFAQPGDMVDFTLRFDNVGAELIGNVTVLDNLTARLEYVPQSAQCSVPARFSTEPSQSDSLVLRWEITDPLKPGTGGVIRFRCRVR